MFPSDSETGLLKYFLHCAWNNEVAVASRELHTWTTIVQCFQQPGSFLHLFPGLDGRTAVSCSGSFPWGCCHSYSSWNVEQCLLSWLFTTRAKCVTCTQAAEGKVSIRFLILSTPVVNSFYSTALLYKYLKWNIHSPEQILLFFWMIWKYSQQHKQAKYVYLYKMLLVRIFKKLWNNRKAY